MDNKTFSFLIQKTMQKKHLISIMIPVVLLSIFLGFLFAEQRHAQKPKNPYAFSSATHPWSKAQDFTLEKTGQGIIIHNQKIPFSDQLAPQWTAEVKKSNVDEWGVDLQSPKTQFNADHLIQQGCWLNLETVQSGDLNQLIQKEIQGLEKLASHLSTGPVFQSSTGLQQLVLTGDHHSAIKESSRSINQRQMITVYLPLDKGQIIKLEGQFYVPNLKDCQQGLKTILQTMKISQP